MPVTTTLLNSHEVQVNSRSCVRVHALYRTHDEELGNALLHMHPEQLSDSSNKEPPLNNTVAKHFRKTSSSYAVITNNVTRF
jgi:hypothetical protein